MINDSSAYKAIIRIRIRWIEFIIDFGTRFTQWHHEFGSFHDKRGEKIENIPDFSVTTFFQRCINRIRSLKHNEHEGDEIWETQKARMKLQNVKKSPWMKLENKENEKWEELIKDKKQGEALAIYKFENIRRLSYQVGFIYVMMLPLFTACIIFNSWFTFDHTYFKLNIFFF